MRFLLNILFLFLSINISFSQDDYRTWIKGKVLYKNVSVPSANVINNTSQAATTTNDDGEFEIIDVKCLMIIFLILEETRIQKE